MPRWFAAGALGLSLTVGCSHSRTNLGSNHARPVIASAASNGQTAPGTVVPVVETASATGVGLAVPQDIPTAPVVHQVNIGEPVPVGRPTFDPAHYPAEFAAVRANAINPAASGVGVPAVSTVPAPAAKPSGEVVAAVRTIPAPGAAKPAPFDVITTPAVYQVPASQQTAAAKPEWAPCEGPAMPNPSIVAPVVQAAIQELPLQQPADGNSPFAPVRQASLEIATPCYGHAQNYSWVRGQVSICRRTKTWRLRYLPVDQIDAYGGSVTLMGTWNQLATLKDEQWLTVRGHLCKPGREEIAPVYCIEAIEKGPKAN